MKIKLRPPVYLAVAFIIFGIGLSAYAETSTTQTVPDLIGLSEPKAQSEIMLAGMTLGSTTQSSSASIQAGNIIAQNPTPGTSVVPGTAVDVVVSAGPARFDVPDVVGLPQADAQDKIVAAGLVVGRVTPSNSENIPIGNVISQVPLAETPLPRGWAVNLVVSTGPP